MRSLRLETPCTLLRLVSDDGPAGATLPEQARAYLATCPYLLLDVRGVQFNSMMIGEIVNLYSAFSNLWQGRTHRLALVNADDFSRRVFETTHLTERIPVYASLDEALAAEAWTPGA